jgi:hypothetical protein
MSRPSPTGITWREDPRSRTGGGSEPANSVHELFVSTAINPAVHVVASRMTLVGSGGEFGRRPRRGQTAGTSPIRIYDVDGRRNSQRTCSRRSGRLWLALSARQSPAHVSLCSSRLSSHEYLSESRARGYVRNKAVDEPKIRLFLPRIRWEFLYLDIPVTN